MDQIEYLIIDALRLGLPYGLLALGIFLTYRVLDFPDLTAEGSFTTGGAVTVIIILAGVNPWLATICGMIAGGIAGIITGLLYAKAKIPNLLSGIITMTGLFTINEIIMGLKEGNKTGYDIVARLGTLDTIYNTFDIFQKRNYNAILTALLVVILIIMLIYWFFGTEIGMSIRATGMNPKMSRAQGINTTLMVIVGLSLSNALIALGGSLTAQLNTFVSRDSGAGGLVYGLSAIIIGEAVFGKKTFKNWLISVVAGSIIYYVIIEIAYKLGLQQYFNQLMYALLITFVLILPLLKKHNNKEGNHAGIKTRNENI